ncbi:MAG: phospholipase D-like domain-containing protein [Candidatus Undinarchaeales archaeon]|nr:phospholipase D-like domain-containing protein [Candidatus Undinarchaeales archaeon]MDP7493088.1 phospholipase D-like domain-containing protein [Candidatus Undinarchaeales archaeon]
MGLRPLLPIIILVVCVAVAAYWQEPSIPYEAAPTPTVHFCPREPCGDILAAAILSAHRSVSCAFYDVDHPAVVAALRRTSARVVVHGRDGPAGIPVRWGHAERALMHNKFCIIDDQLVVTCSFNPTGRGAARNDNVLLQVRSRLLAAAYNAEFEELWEGVFSAGDPTVDPVMELGGTPFHVAFCPDDGCRELIVDVIDGAERDVRFLAFSFTDGAVADALIRAVHRGVSVSGVCERVQARRWERCTAVQSAGGDVRADGNKGMMHHKTFIVDDETVMTGSANPTKGGLMGNDENILVIRDGRLGASFKKEFRRVWTESTPWGTKKEKGRLGT